MMNVETAANRCVTRGQREDVEETRFTRGSNFRRMRGKSDDNLTIS